MIDTEVPTVNGHPIKGWIYQPVHTGRAGR